MTTEGHNSRHRIGFLVNPLAGIGGRVGLKGSDGIEVVERAFALGAVPTANTRAAETLSHLGDLASLIELGTYPGEMGARAAAETGFETTLVGTTDVGRTTGEDTRRAASELCDWQAELIVFAGGDGTARDVTAAIQDTTPVIGIPAGVKIHSSVFAVTPTHVADVVREFLVGRTRLEEREVLDIDEDLFRSGVVVPRLYGYLRVPCVRDLVQRAKAGSRSDPSTLRGVAFGVLDEIERDADAYYILGSRFDCQGSWRRTADRQDPARCGSVPCRKAGRKGLKRGASTRGDHGTSRQDRGHGHRRSGLRFRAGKPTAESAESSRRSGVTTSSLSPRSASSTL